MQLPPASVIDEIFNQSSSEQQVKILSSLMLTMLSMTRTTDFGELAKEFALCEWLAIVQQTGIERFREILLLHIRNSNWFPTIAELRTRAGLNEQTQEQIEANQAWQWIRFFSTHHWHPDIGPYRGAPPIPPRIDYALRQVGGLHVIASCSNARLPFMRQDFINAFSLAPFAAKLQLEAEPSTLNLLQSVLEKDTHS